MDPVAANAPRIVHGPVPTRDFTVISNSILRDERLSYRARGVLAEILSHGPDWAPDAVEMSQRGKEGRDAIYAAFDELAAAGYVRRERRQIRGRWTHRTVFYANPQVAPTTDFQESVARMTRRPHLRRWTNPQVAPTTENKESVVQELYERQRRKKSKTLLRPGSLRRLRSPTPSPTAVHPLRSTWTRRSPPSRSGRTSSACALIWRTGSWGTEASVRKSRRSGGMPRGF